MLAVVHAGLPDADSGELEPGECYTHLGIPLLIAPSVLTPGEGSHVFGAPS